MIRHLLRPLLHALELDHSPSRSVLGACPCKSCQRTYLELDLRGRSPFAVGLERGLAEPIPSIDYTLRTLPWREHAPGTGAQNGTSAPADREKSDK